MWYYFVLTWCWSYFTLNNTTKLLVWWVTSQRVLTYRSCILWKALASLISEALTVSCTIRWTILLLNTTERTDAWTCDWDSAICKSSLWTIANKLLTRNCYSYFSICRITNCLKASCAGLWCFIHQKASGIRSWLFKT